MECPNCNQMMWHQRDDDVVDEWYCHACGETFIDSGDWPMPGEQDEAWDDGIVEWVPAPDDAITPRQRIERAVAAVCEVAASIRSRLTGREELPF